MMSDKFKGTARMVSIYDRRYDVIFIWRAKVLFNTKFKNDTKLKKNNTKLRDQTKLKKKIILS